jgi:glycerophosphoryl diester phosphodiesterase
VHAPTTRPTKAHLQTPAIIGHRGMGISRANPANPYVENTRAAFRAAHAAGATWVEMDLLVSADGDLVVFHDHFLARPGHPPVPVWTLPTDTLTREGIETLDGLCADLPPDLGLYLEVKVTPGDARPDLSPGSVEAVTEFARTHGGHRPLIAASFDPFVAARLNTPDLIGAWIGNESHRLHHLLVSATHAGLPLVVAHRNAFSLAPHEQELAATLRAASQVTVWAWDADLSQVPHYRQSGVSAFCVDEVADAVAVLALACTR